MSPLDIIILGVILVAAIVGAMKGFIHQAGTICGIILGIVVCRLFGPTLVARFVNPAGAHAEAYRVGLYILLFIAVLLVVRLLAGMIVKLFGTLHIRLVDRIAGAVFSVGVWLLLASIAVNVYLLAVPADRTHFATPTKPWRTTVASFAPSVMGYMATEMRD